MHVASAVAGALSVILTLGASPPSGATTTADVTLSGVYTEVHGDSKYGDQTMYFLKSAGHYYQLKIAAEPKVRSRSRVTVRGSLTGGTVSVATPSRIQATAPAPAIAAIGNKTVLVINVLWAGTPLTATAAQEQNFMFGSDSRTLASYYADASYGQMTWTGTVTPNYTITNPGTCDLYSLSGQAESAATAGGYSPSSYTALIINAPNLYCGAAGYGEIRGNHTWVQDGLWNLDDGYSRLVPTHEIGHSLGLYHSHGLECGAVTVDATCLASPNSHSEEYGNAWDVMGNNWPGDGADSVTWFSAKEEMLLGWLGGSRVLPVSTSGTYPLTPLEQQGVTTPQVLVISTPGNTYYVEYRQPIGQDAFLASYPGAINGVHVNVSSPSNADTGPFALDFTPESNTASAYSDWYDAPLAIGRSFADPENVFTLTPISRNGTTASVRVTFAAPTAYPLAVTKSGTGSGTVTSSPAGINCGAACSASYSGGTTGTLTATPASGSTFSGWGGACSGTGPTCAVTVNAASTVTAAFTATVTGTTSQESATAVAYNSWNGIADSVASGGAFRNSTITGSTATFKFTGTAVTWLTRKGPGQGIAGVNIDGVNKGNVDLYASTVSSVAKAFTGLSSGAHTLIVNVSGTKNSAATGFSVAVDGFTVAATTTQESAATITYGTWVGSSSAMASGSAYRASGTANATATFSFTGTGVDWITATGKGWGKAQVAVDGIDRGSVDLYTAAAHWQTVKAYTGLAAGAHTITIKVLGTKNTAATSTKVSVDAFTVH